MLVSASVFKILLIFSLATSGHNIHGAGTRPSKDKACGFEVIRSSTNGRNDLGDQPLSPNALLNKYRVPVAPVSLPHSRALVDRNVADENPNWTSYIYSVYFEADSCWLVPVKSGDQTQLSRLLTLVDLLKSRGELTSFFGIIEPTAFNRWAESIEPLSLDTIPSKAGFLFRKSTRIISLNSGDADLATLKKTALKRTLESIEVYARILREKNLSCPSLELFADLSGSVFPWGLESCDSAQSKGEITSLTSLADQVSRLLQKK